MPNVIQSLLKGVVWRLPLSDNKQSGKGEIPQQIRNEKQVWNEEQVLNEKQVWNEKQVRKEKQVRDKTNPHSCEGRYLNGRLVQGGDKALYLTFDDGPNPETTPWLLEVLRKNKIKATFFLVGENAQRYPDLVRQIKADGHIVGTHTYNHLKGWCTPTCEYVLNIKKAEQAIQPNSVLFRPPYGKMSIQQFLEIKKEHTIVLWDLITHDYDKNHSPEMILKAIRKYSRDGSIVVFHDSLKAQANLFAVIGEAIDFWKDTGYEFCVLG